MNKIIKELLVLHFFNDGIRTTFVTMLPFIAKDLNFNLASVGFLGSTQPLIASILALPAGFFAAKFGGFYFLLTLLAVYSLGALGVSISTNLFFLTISFLLGALGFGMFHTVGFSLVAKNSHETKIGRNMGNFTSIGDIGRVAIPTVTVFLIPFFGWRATMLGVAVLGLIMYGLLRFFRISKETHLYEKAPVLKETHGDFIKMILNLLRSKKLILTLFASIIDSFASSPVYIFLPFLLLAKGVEVTQYGIIMGVFFFGSLFGRTVIGRATDKFGNAKVFIVAEIFMAISLILLTISSHFASLLGLSFMLGMFTRGTTPAVQTMFSQTVDKIHYDKIYALSEMFTGIAAMITVVLMGLIADKVGIYLVFYAASILAFLATIPALLLLKSR